ncbi:STY0301 family protein [Rugamonas rivuli]|uniref:STY0301 family protein n=1 Tax=Rugamonas rivuli TaxID=2743358 RepID=UPI0038B5C8A4
MHTAASLLIAALSGLASAEVPQCPTEISASAVQIKSSPGWRGLVPTRLLLANAGLVIGPPDLEPRAELRGDYTQLNARLEKTTYSGLASREKWLICSYGQGGEIEQAYRLPESIDRCIVRRSRNQYNEVGVEVSCCSFAR